MLSNQLAAALTMSKAPLRLNILSDLHLSRDGLPIPQTGADIVVLAGDISRPKEAIEWARGFTQPVLYVPGNHEFYGGSLKSTLAQLRDYAHGTHIHVLDNDEIVLGGVRFLGSTLWTDFNLYGGGPARDDAITQALGFIRDFVRIESGKPGASTLTPEEMEETFNANRGWLDRMLGHSFDGPTVVITHHAPSMKSIHPRFEGSPINTCFVSDSEYLISRERAVLWIHGHTHDSFDYSLRGTRVVCNPRGYARDGVNENTAFNPELVIEIDRP
jgi:predicted phosphodiesterase